MPSNASGIGCFMDKNRGSIGPALYLSMPVDTHVWWFANALRWTLIRQKRPFPIAGNAPFNRDFYARLSENNHDNAAERSQPE